MDPAAQPHQPQLQPGQPAYQPPPGQVVAQQYVVTINGDVTGQHPPVNIKAIGGTATAQLVCTVLIILLGVLAILAGCVNSMDAMPIWAGLFFYMVAGILGRVAVRKRNNCSVIAYMVLSILSALTSGSLVLSLIPALLFESEVGGDHHPFPPPVKVPVGARMAIDGAIIVVGLTEGVLAIVASAFCCRGTCCAPPSPLQVQYSPAIPAGSVVIPQVQGQPVSIPQGQTILINPGPPPASYEAGPLPVKSALPTQDAPVNQTTAHTPLQVTGQGPPDVPQPTNPDAVGHDAARDDGTDKQPLVM